MNIDVGMPKQVEWSVGVGLTFDLLSLGYTARDIELLNDLLQRARSQVGCGVVHIWFRPQARKRRAPVFAFKRLPWPKRRKGNGKRMPGVVVWDSFEGFRCPFPEVGDEH